MLWVLESRFPTLVADTSTMCVNQSRLGASLETAYSGEVACTVGEVVSMLWSHEYLFLNYYYMERGFRGKGSVCHDSPLLCPGGVSRYFIHIGLVARLSGFDWESGQPKVLEV